MVTRKKGPKLFLHSEASTGEESHVGPGGGNGVITQTKAVLEKKKTRGGAVSVIES